MNEFFQPVLDTIAANPEWAGVIIFMVGLIETIVIIGYLLPGTWLMLGYGFLVGTGAIGFDVAMIGMTAGGIAGDAIGYWIGRRYGRRIFKLRWFDKHQALVARSENFFAKHGGKAVFLARMLGPVRPLVPFFAGLARMNQIKFTVFNIASAIVGSFVYLLPGMALGLGLQFTGAMTWRLVIFVLLLTFVVWLCYEAARRAARWLTASGPIFAVRLHDWARDPARRQSRLERGVAWLLIPFVDPRHRATVAMALLGVIALGAFDGMTILLGDVIGGEPITHVNVAVGNFLSDLHTRWADHLMAAVMGLGDGPVLLPLVGAVLLVLLLRRDWVVTGYWALTAAFAYATALVLERVVPLPSAAAVASGSSAFPSAHAAIWVIVIGYLAILCLPTVSAARWRLAILFAASVFVALISIAQLYFGRLVISSLAGGLLLGLGWLLVLTVVTRRHIPRPSPNWGRVLGLSAFAVIAVAGSVSFALQTDDPTRRYAPPEVQRLISGNEWRESDWQELPSFRSDFLGNESEPLNAQIGGSLDSLRDAALAAGWRDPPDWGVVQVVTLLTAAGSADAAARPVLPRLWNGKVEAIILIKPQGERRLVLRLWESGFRLAPDGVPLYLGTAEQEAERPAIVFGSIHLPPRAAGFDQAAAELAEDTRGTLLYRHKGDGAGGDAAARSRGAVAIIAPTAALRAGS